jgi:bifunctional non-homologous end joining protein LigD
VNFQKDQWLRKGASTHRVYLGRIEDGDLVYPASWSAAFRRMTNVPCLSLGPLRVRKKPMASARKGFPKAKWVTPRVLVDAEFRGKTGEGLLRHPSFKGVREDLM